jgi:hypothetical protein
MVAQVIIQYCIYDHYYGVRMDDQARAERTRSIEELAARITEFAGHMNAATYHWLTMIAEFDRCKGWAMHATHSCAHWLNWKVGMAMGAAREKVRVARALENLPKTAAAMERGELSYSNARAITRVACANTEESLLMIARHGTAGHVERVVRAFRRCKEAAELSREAQQQANRYLRYRYAEDGSIVLEAQLPTEAGALFLKALAAGLPESSEPKPTGFKCHDVSAETSVPRVPIEKRRADALGVIAESFLKHGIESLSGGDRHQIVVHVEAETLHECTAGRCEIEDGPSIAAETARRLACDSTVVALIENDEGEPLDVGRRTRTISPALRRLLNARDEGCRFPGCCATAQFVDAHHIHHWADGGETKPSNLLSLCRHHHRCVHEEGFQIRVLDDGAVRFLRPDGRAIDSVAGGHTQPLGDWQYLATQNGERGVHITENTAATKWAGERIEYGLAVEVLLQRWRRGGLGKERVDAGSRTADVSGETSA